MALNFFEIPRDQGFSVLFASLDFVEFRDFVVLLEGGIYVLVYP